MNNDFYLGLQIDLINACNLKCSFCLKCPFCDWHRKQGSHRNGKAVTVQMLETIWRQIDASTENPVRSIWFVGGGEPLLYEFLPDAVRRAKQLDVKPRVSLVTNGVLLSKSVSVQLIDAGIDEVDISITGSSVGTYVKFQGSGHSLEQADEIFQNVSANTKDLCDIKKTTKVFISYLYSDDSAKDLPAALNYWRNMGVDALFTRPLQICEEVSAIETSAAEEDASVDNADVVGTCPIFGKMMQLTVEGDLHFCCMVHPATKLGNIFVTPLSDILTSPFFKRLETAFINGQGDIPKYCRLCSCRSIALRS